MSSGYGPLEPVIVLVVGGGVKGEGGGGGGQAGSFVIAFDEGERSLIGKQLRCFGICMVANLPPPQMDGMNE